MTPRLGCIADDFSGATDLANNLARAGMRVVLYPGVATGQVEVDADAIVVALKARTIAAAEAVSQALAACRWLRARQAGQIYFKVCSTFDSTPRGNIGPVIEALMDELGSEFSVCTPAFPENGRTVFQGHLFVGAALLSESGMRHHPLTPMADANLVRVLQEQLSCRKAGLIAWRSVAAGAEAISDRIKELRAEGAQVAIADAVSQADLEHVAEAVQDAPMVTASSGLATSLPRYWGFRPSLQASQLPPAQGSSAIISGSCSDATNTQVESFIARGGSAYRLDPLQLAEHGDLEVRRALEWAETLWRGRPDAPALLYASARHEAVEAVHGQLGVAAAGTLIEQALGTIAAHLVARGTGRLIVAGGETSGVCVQQLGIAQMLIGPQIAPGVPWCYVTSVLGRPGGLHLALKSGNFGGDDFFERAFRLLAGDAA